MLYHIFLNCLKYMLMAAKVRISERNTKLVWEFPSESAFGNSQRYE